MSPNLRELVESDLSLTLEGDWGLPVELIDPDGVEYTTSVNSPDPLNPLPLNAQVLSNSFESDPETGAQLLTEKPVVVLRLSSLARIPKAGERWGIRIPEKPSVSATKVFHVITADRPPFLNESIGYIKLYPQKASQA